MKDKNIIVLGGAGYIGSHTCKRLKSEGFNPVVIDNLSHGHQDVVKWGPFEKADILDTACLTDIMNDYEATAIIHFAGLIEVAESVKNPNAFYENNVEGTRSVLNAMQLSGVNHIVFSSTAAVYGQPEDNVPLGENLPLNPINPYGNTKLAAERMIRDYEQSAYIKSICLRYFNACGASEDATIGEMHYPETHLVPLVAQTALGMRDQISIFGVNYETKDGTCVRDYIHVEDLADAHVRAVKYLINGGETTVCNLGSGFGYSVKEIIVAMQNVTGQNDLPVKIADRRAGDPSTLVADNSRARKILGWEPSHSLLDIVQSAHAWHASDRYKEFWENKIGTTVSKR